ncbi:MAG: DPP IV N-terminal domain-containing protein [Planctomycetota bacterium]
MRTAHALAAVLATASTIAGCTQHYTGSLGLGFQDKQQVASYEDFKTRQQAQLQRAKELASQQQPTRFADEGAVVPQAQNEPGERFVSTAGAPVSPPVRPAALAPSGAAPASSPGSIGATLAAPSRPYAAPAARQGSPVSVYGGLSASAGRAATSPLDGGANLDRITFTAEGADFDVDVDPSGRKLVFASTRHRSTSDLYLQTVGGTAVTQLTSSPGNDVMPQFSPDGKHVVFASDRSGNWDLYLVPLAGGKPVQLTRDTTDELHPSFSPDGKQIVYCTYGNNTGQWQLVVIDLDRPDAARYIGPGMFPEWSPTDDRIVFQRSRERGTRWFSIWTVELEDGEATRPTEVAASPNAALITPSWSPDGQMIVFSTVTDPAGVEDSAPRAADVWVMAADGGQRFRVTEGVFANLAPAWSPDMRLYFVSDRARDGAENVWSVRPEGLGRLVQGPTYREPQAPTAVLAPTEQGN